MRYRGEGRGVRDFMVVVQVVQVVHEVDGAMVLAFGETTSFQFFPARIHAPQAKALYALPLGLKGWRQGIQDKAVNDKARGESPWQAMCATQQ